jgi:FkbM family methyltransferase
MTTLINNLFAWASKFRFAAKIAVKLRNQCNLLIGRYLGFNSDSAINGEFLAVDYLAGKCETFADVGANVGIWASRFLDGNPNSKGFLFEPSLQCQSALRSLFANRNIEYFECGLADFVGEAAFTEQEDYGQLSSLADVYVGTGAAKTRSVPISTLDQVFYDSETNLDYVKIDAEGMDFPVVLGATRLLEAGRIRFLQFEYNSNWIQSGASLSRMNALLERFGFQTFLIRPDGLYKLNYEYWDEFFAYSNFLACRQDSLGLISSLQRGVI